MPGSKVLRLIYLSIKFQKSETLRNTTICAKLEAKILPLKIPKIEISKP